MSPTGYTPGFECTSILHPALTNSVITSALFVTTATMKVMIYASEVSMNKCENSN